MTALRGAALGRSLFGELFGSLGRGTEDDVGSDG